MSDYTEQVGPVTRLRDFHGQYQAQPTWCWAATVASVHAYMMTCRERLVPGLAIPAYPQCYFVDRQKAGRTCRHRRFDPAGGFGEPGTERLDCQKLRCSIHDQIETGYPEAAMQDPNLDIHARTEERPVSFSRVRAEIDAGRPVVIRLERAGSAHHIVTITGYRTDVPGYLIWDPSRGAVRVSVNGLQRREGRWTHTLFTRFHEDAL